ncbi:MAG: hypothetical protein JO081_05045 [Alphaproteobacteria bacterium]|nr:hypothetical protein [Alphaproteobacteria bacterium]
MSLVRFAAAVIAASVLWIAPAAAGGPQHPFKYGYWSGGAYTDDHTGAFTHCSAGVAYDSGINLFVLVTQKYHWWLGFIDPKWSLTPNVKAPIRLRLDGAAPFDRMATIPNGQLLLVPLPDSSRLIDAFRHSSELAVNVEGQSFYFRLNETPAIMDRLGNCVRTAAAVQDKMPSSETVTAPPSEAKAGPADQPAKSSALPPAAASAATASSPPPAAPPKTTASASAADTASSAQPAAGGTPDATAAASGPSSPSTKAAASPSAADSSPSALAAPFGTPSASPANPARSAAASDTTAAASDARQKSTPIPTTGSLSPHARSGNVGPDAAKLGDASNPAHQPLSSPAPSSAATPQSVQTTSTARPVTTARREADGSPESKQRSPDTSGAALQPSSPPPRAPDATGQTPPVSGVPHLAFTAVSPVPPGLAFPLEPASATALEELRLATDFLAKARLPEAHLVGADKPAALADFAAVWRADDAAGAVKIIPPAADTSAVDIASNLITVDPQVCKGDFAAARYRTPVGNSAVFSAVLSCSEANERRVTEYFIAPRHQGGFVVFAVIRRVGVGEVPDFDRHTLDELARAAIQAAGGEG